MKLYLSGPMSGKPGFNIEAFDQEAEALRKEKHKVVSPAELDDPKFRLLCLACEKGKMSELAFLCKQNKVRQESWGSLLARDIKLLADDGIEGVVVLPGWEQSKGALLETFAARVIGLPIFMDCGPGIGPEPLEGWVIERAHAKAGGHLHTLNTPKPPPPKPSGPLPPGFEERTCSASGVRSFPPGHVITREDLASISAPEKGQFSSPESERRVVSASGGEKGAKDAVLGDLDPAALMEVAKVAGFGRQKYSRLNYAKGFDWSLCYDAAQRHLHAFWNREDTDSESGLSHLAHAAWQCLTMLCFFLRHIGNDDRPRF